MRFASMGLATACTYSDVLPAGNDRLHRSTECVPGCVWFSAVTFCPSWLLYTA